MMAEKTSHLEKATWQFLIFIGLIAACWLLGKFLHIDEESLKSCLSQFPLAWSSLLFIFLYVGLQFLSEFSKDLLKPTAVILFGFSRSCLLIWVGEAINAVIWFYLSRKLGRGFVVRKTGPKFQYFDQRVAQAAWGDLFALRAVILVPYRILDPAMGLTSVAFRKYFSAVLLGSPLRIALIQGFIILMKDVLLNMARILETGGWLEVATFFTDYVDARPYLVWFSLGYLLAVGFLLVRLKTLLWGSAASR
jgi:uncharacterized membrane protein YdjX (TVP38/TMEM64 family)